MRDPYRYMALDTKALGCCELPAYIITRQALYLHFFQTPSENDAMQYSLA